MILKAKQFYKNLLVTMLVVTKNTDSEFSALCKNLSTKFEDMQKKITFISVVKF